MFTFTLFIQEIPAVSCYKIVFIYFIFVCILLSTNISRILVQLPLQDAPTTSSDDPLTYIVWR